jgi:hypothetical protein
MENYKYYNEEQINEVIAHYDVFLMKCIDVLYVAAVAAPNDEEGKYAVEIGLKQKQRIQIKSVPKPHTYFGAFDEFIIPSELPVPSECVFSIKSQLGKIKNFDQESFIIDENQKEKYAPPILVFAHEDKLWRSYGFTKDSEKKQLLANDNWQNDKWYEYQYGGQPIYGVNGYNGTLGGVFRLMEFPNDVFGISNWHILTAGYLPLGSPIFSTNDNKVRGYLFWKGLSIGTESAFIKLTDIDAQKMYERYDLKNKNWKLGQPKNGMKVTHLGWGSNSGGMSGRVEKIRSVNATVRISLSTVDEHNKIFRNQILIEDFSTGGDSGALVLNAEDEKTAVGLIFGKTTFDLPFKDEKKRAILSVANNLNTIFNSPHKEIQEVFMGSEPSSGIIKTSLTSSFTLEHFEFYNHLNHNIMSNIQRVEVTQGSTSMFNFFNDVDLDLDAQFSWDSSNEKVTSIVFSLANLRATKFKICKLTRCNVAGKDYIVIHLSMAGVQNQFTYTASTAEISPLSLKKNESMPFFFKVYPTDCGLTYDCNLEGGTPKTKDGTIIVSI